MVGVSWSPTVGQQLTMRPGGESSIGLQKWWGPGTPPDGVRLESLGDVHLEKEDLTSAYLQNGGQVDGAKLLRTEQTKTKNPCSICFSTGKQCSQFCTG